jgi:nucleotide-binding universal stress UspA family protein
VSGEVAPRAGSKTIVVAVDGSTASTAALDWAIEEARASDRELLLVYVVSLAGELATSVWPMLGAPDVSALGQEVLRHSSSKCERSAVRHSGVSVEGPVVENLVRISSGAAMLVLGGHLRHPSPPPSLESVLQGCLHQCRCPLVVVKGPK